MPKIVINNFHKGQSSSPYIADGAYAKAVNLDVFSLPGIARINWLPALKSGTTIDALPTGFAKNPDSATEVFCTDSNGVVYRSANAGDTWTELITGKGSDPIVWKDYLFVCSTTALKTYGPLSGTPAWTDDYQTLNDTGEHAVFVSRNDGKLYICNGNDSTTGLGEIASLEQVDGEDFDDDNGDTFAWTHDALSIPEGYTPLCLEEQRENLLIGTIYGAAASSVPKSTIFIWDREKNEYDYQVAVFGNAINSMINIADRVYISAGKHGKIWLFSEAGLIPYTQIPFDYTGDYIDVGSYNRQQGLAGWKDMLLIGMESLDALSPAGVFGIKNKARNLEYLISTGEDGSNDDLYITSVFAVDDKHLLIGWYDVENTSYGVDKIDDDSATQYRVPSYAAYLESLYYRVGTPFKLANFQQISIQLARPLQTGEGVRIKYRTDINASWTTLDTFDYATYGALSSHKLPFTIQGAENLQIRADLTTGASSVNTPYLFEIRVE